MAKRSSRNSSARNNKKRNGPVLKTPNLRVPFVLERYACFVETEFVRYCIILGLVLLNLPVTANITKIYDPKYQKKLSLTAEIH